MERMVSKHSATSTLSWNAFHLVTGMFILALALHASGLSASGKPPKLFESDDLMEITLTGPLKTVQRKKTSDIVHDGTLQYTTTEGAERVISVGIRTRGRSRRDVACDFPPLKLFFDKAENKGTEFRGLKSLKLVAYCGRENRNEQYNIKEYLAYRIYNLITPYSFRVRPLMITYQQEGGRKLLTRFGFLIEDIDDVANRNDLEELKRFEISPSELKPEHAVNYALFQYLISNLDWAATRGPSGEDCCHNGKLIGQTENDPTVYVIPYDFDSSGIVNTHYAAVPPKLGVRRVTQRLYRGFCVHNGAVGGAVERYLNERDRTLELIENHPLLDKRNRRATLGFVSEFYETLSTPEGVESEITGKCRR